jgi:hypothetical protein
LLRLVLARAAGRVDSVIESAKKRKSRAGAADDDMTILTMQLADDKSILD